MGSTDEIGNNGYFFVPNKLAPSSDPRSPLRVICGDGLGWEHISVSLPYRCPTWEEMCFIKDLFWDDDDVVMQLHPAKKDYVNDHPYCLHMWRPIDAVIPTPPAWMVGTPQSEK